MTRDTAVRDMTPEELRRWGREAVDWVANYLEIIEKRPVLSQVQPGDIRRRLPGSAPEAGESMDAILADLDDVIMPGITHWGHPAFFAYFSSSAAGAGVLAELIAAGLNVNGMLWKTSPSATELEETVLDWLRQMLGLSDRFEGVVYDTASVSTFHALAAARNAIPEWNVAEDGLSGPNAPRLSVYTSEQAHSSVEKAGLALGIGRRGIRKIPVDGEFRMDPGALEAAIERDRAEGWRPFCVCATIGTTSTTSIDPVEAIADICDRERLWLHVDAAYAGAAAVLPERSGLLAGCDRADSFVMNPHKWLFTPIDFSAFFSRRREAVKEAFSLVPEYLETAEGDAVTNYMDFGIPLGRRFRALKLWMVIRYFGVDGLRSVLREHIRLARKFADWVEADSGFELAAPVPFSTVCFRLKGTNEVNAALLDRVNSTGKAFISHTTLDDRFILRFSVGNLRTTEEHVRRAWKLIRENARSV